MRAQPPTLVQRLLILQMSALQWQAAAFIPGAPPSKLTRGEIVETSLPPPLVTPHILLIEVAWELQF